MISFVIFVFCVFPTVFWLTTLRTLDEMYLNNMCYFQSGRLVQIEPATREGDYTVPAKKVAPVWGVIINFEKVQTAVKESFDGESQGQNEIKFKVDILVNCVTVEEEGRTKLVQPVSLDETGEPAVVSIPLNQVR